MQEHFQTFWLSDSIFLLCIIVLQFSYQAHCYLPQLNKSTWNILVFTYHDATENTCLRKCHLHSLISNCQGIFHVCLTFLPPVKWRAARRGISGPWSGKVALKILPVSTSTAAILCQKKSDYINRFLTLHPDITEGKKRRRKKKKIIITK